MQRTLLQSVCSELKQLKLSTELLRTGAKRLLTRQQYMSHSASFKAKVALAAIRGDNTPPELSPIQEMQERFLWHCVYLSILKIVTIH